MKIIKLSIVGGLLCATFMLASSAEAQPKFRLPLSSDTSVHYYYDNNSSSGISDWKCGTETYNGHRGTDYSGGPRGRAIFAGAVGTLSYKIDGFGDGYRGSPDGGGFGNYVRLAHSSGYMSYYAHMTKGSVTTKAVGSSIACGEQIGGVGTSGSSTGFHLHFEVRVNGTADDPYSGACGGPISFWVNQGSGSPSTTCQGGTSKTARTVDNNASGFSVIGTWSTGTSATDKHGADYRFKSTAPVSEPATWVTSLNTSASWTVRAWWPAGSNRSSSAPYIVSHGGGTTTVNKNQQVNGGSWQTLGTWSMGGSQNVKLSCWTTTGYVVMADAIRWE
ncbi:MAG: peptidoglycan DD-metalloendopeptidase family protein [Verrucomicrobia bacterium]|nr:peptidoglycan DD-metalloendopeptidase family protein [Verrucomicrobiota bacterium]